MSIIYPNVDLKKALREELHTVRLLYAKYCSTFVERWEWLASTNTGALKREFYRKYMGRTGSVWKSEYAELNPDVWSMPIYETGVNTQQPSPWNNAIHLRNSKDGTTLDEIYLAPRIWMKPPCALLFDGYFPALNTANYPNGTYVAIGFEINSGGYIGNLYALEILSDGTTVTVRLRGLGMEDGAGSVISTSVSGLVTDSWRGFKLFLEPHRFALYQGTTAGQGYPLELVAELPIRLDDISAVMPFFANESSTIVSGIYVGQFQVFEYIQNKRVDKIIDAASIAASGSVDSSMLVLPSEFALTVKVTYDASATAGVRVYILASNDYSGSSIDTEDTGSAYAYFDMPFTAGGTFQKTVAVDGLPKYGIIRIRNLDSTYATGAVQAWIHRRF